MNTEARTDLKFYELAKECLAALDSIGFPKAFVTSSDEGGHSFYWGPAEMYGGSLWVTIEPSDDDPEIPEVWVTADDGKDRMTVDRTFREDHVCGLMFAMGEVVAAIRQVNEEAADEQATERVEG